MSPEVLWRPQAGAVETTRTGEYLEWLDSNRGLRFETYDALWAWSVGDLEAFWSSVWEFFDVTAHTPASTTLTTRAMPGARWFEGATLNYAEHALRSFAESDVAVIARSQTRPPRDLTGRELLDQVGRARAGLRRLGVTRGDRVAAYLPNIEEAVVAFLATASLGAIWVSCAPEFGVRSALSRLQQIEPKVLLAADGYRYGAREFDRRDAVAELRRQLPSLEAIVSVPFLNEAASSIAGAATWESLLARHETLTFEPVPFAHPLYILFSSGTTGLPKPIVHGHGGILLEHLKFLSFHLDLGAGDRFFWYSSTGWTMWNIAVSGLLVGATVVCFEGDPAYPDLLTLWRLAQETQTTYLGAGASYFQACRGSGIEPGTALDLTSLRGIGSTGSPLSPEAFRWVYQHVSPDVLLSSVSGGTDVCTAFVGGSPLVPVYAGEISCRCLGANVVAMDAAGAPVTGKLGELVVTEPMPSMPVGFWKDPDGSRYRDAYFKQFPGRWRQGDWIEFTDRGTCRITGRSDATLNRGGVRLGTAEFYDALEALPEVSDALVVHLEDPNGGMGELILLVATSEAGVTDTTLAERIKRELRVQLSPRHVPDRVFRVSALPRTLTGKKLEVPVKRIFRGEPVERVLSADAVTHPEALRAIESLARSFYEQRDAAPVSSL